MKIKDEKTKSGDRIALFIDKEEEQFSTVWYGLCGYDSVEMHFKFPLQAERAFNALLNVSEVETD